MTINEAILHLESRFGPREETGIRPEDVEDWIPTALERTKEWALANGHRADVQKQAAVALDGEGAAAIPTDMLAGRITCINHASTPYDSMEVGVRGDLQFVFADGFLHHALESGKVYTKPPTGIGDPLTGDLLITGLFPVTLSDLTASHKLTPYFLDQLQELAAERKKIDPIGPDQPS